MQILRTEQHNRFHPHNILKLSGVPHGDGQHRLRLRRFRFSYDIYPRNVVPGLQPAPRRHLQLSAPRLSSLPTIWRS